MVKGLGKVSKSLSLPYSLQLFVQFLHIPLATMFVTLTDTLTEYSILESNCYSKMIALAFTARGQYGTPDQGLLKNIFPVGSIHYRYIGALGARVICDNIPGLVNKQRQLCQGHPDLMQSIGEGAKEWIRECQHQFRYHRWNCSTLDRDHTVFGRVMLRSESPLT